jgi:hypothetical protein
MEDFFNLRIIKNFFSIYTPHPPTMGKYKFSLLVVGRKAMEILCS